MINKRWVSLLPPDRRGRRGLPNGNVGEGLSKDTVITNRVTDSQGFYLPLWPGHPHILLSLRGSNQFYPSTEIFGGKSFLEG